MLKLQRNAHSHKTIHQDVRDFVMSQQQRLKCLSPGTVPVDKSSTSFFPIPNECPHEFIVIHLLLNIFFPVLTFTHASRLQQVTTVAIAVELGSVELQDPAL